MRGFILTTKGDLQSKIDYTFRIYDQNGDNQISGGEIKKMANVIKKQTSLYEKNFFFLLF
jgi:Ca2+-binding EF-hand superfamily protein